MTVGSCKVHPASAGLHALLREFGRVVALLHDGGLIHGDLTTSNMLLRSPDNNLVTTLPCHWHSGPVVALLLCAQHLRCLLDLTFAERDGKVLHLVPPSSTEGLIMACRC